jgi:hypothetical protein
LTLDHQSDSLSGVKHWCATLLVVFLLVPVISVRDDEVRLASLLQKLNSHNRTMSSVDRPVIDPGVRGRAGLIDQFDNLRVTAVSSLVFDTSFSILRLFYQDIFPDYAVSIRVGRAPPTPFV